MKIQLLFAGLLISGSAALAQTVSAPVAITNSNTESDIIGKAIKPSTNHSSAAAIGNGQIDEVVIGTTVYDLQTNSAIQPRFMLHANGSMSAAWTMALDNSDATFADRGTGYNFYDGTSWGDEPSERLESERVGWASFVTLPGGGEAYIVHTISDGSLFGKRAVAGSGDWEFSNVSNGSKTLNLVWHRMAIGGADGNSLHIIGAENLGTDAEPDYFLRYTRSTDLGVTWDILNLEIPALADFGNVSGDSYSIIADGDNIDFIFGGGAKDVVLMQSVDNGSTWTKNIIWDFPEFDETSDIVDSASTPGSPYNGYATADGAFDLMYDATGEIHAFFGAFVTTNPDTTDGNTNFFIGETTELLHWKETYGYTPDGTALQDGSNNGFTQLDTVAGVQDLNGDGIITGSLANYGGSSMTSYPHTFMASNGDIYLTYSSIIDTLSLDQLSVESEEFEKNYRHQYIKRSTDNGVTWGDRKDLFSSIIQTEDDDNLLEGVFGSILIDDDVCYVLYQRDDVPGLHVNGEEHYVNDNDIVVASFLLSDYDFLFMDETNEGVFTIAPNPATDVVNINLVEGYESAKVTIINTLGQELYAGQVDGLTHTISVAGYQSGLYIVNVIEGNETYSHKLMVK